MFLRLGLDRMIGKTDKATKSDQAFQEMERRIGQIHYYFRNAKLSADVRQLMTYRKLLELEYFTPTSAQVLLRQWIEAEQGAKSISKP